MPELLPVYFTYVDHSLMATFVWRVIELLTGLFGEQSALRPAVAVVRNKYEQFIDVLNRTGASEVTIQIANADALRDSLHAALKYQALAFSHRASHPDQARAGKLLVELIEKAGWQAERGYANETAQLHRLFKDCAEQNAAAAIELLGLQNWFADLVDANRTFEAALAKRVDEYTGNDIPALRVARNELKVAVEGLFGYINVMRLAEPGAYGPAIQGLNELIKDVMANAKAERTREESADTTEAESQAQP
jgi:hypothetical protein